MLAQVRSHRPSPAMVVALVALFVALGGSSYAAITLQKNSVKSRHIANGQVKRVDIQNDAINSSKVATYSLVATDFKPGQLPEGPPGQPGPPGPKGDSGMRSLTVRTATGDSNVTVSCLPGERATGGGGTSVDGYLFGSQPVSHPLAIYAPEGPPAGGYIPTAWTANADDGAGGPAEVTAWVICAAP
jgi:hypothetical protein